VFCFLLSLCVACGNVCASAANRRHNAQLFGDFLKGGSLGEPLQSVEDGLFIGHDSILRHPKGGCKRLQTKKTRPRRMRWKNPSPD